MKKLILLMTILASNAIITMENTSYNEYQLISHPFATMTNNHSAFVKAVALYDHANSPIISSDEIPYWTEILYGRVLPEIGYKIINFATQITKKTDHFLYMRNFMSGNFIVKKELTNCNTSRYEIDKNYIFIRQVNNNQSVICVDRKTLQEKIIYKEEYNFYASTRQGIIWQSKKNNTDMFYESFNSSDVPFKFQISFPVDFYYYMSGEFLFLKTKEGAQTGYYLYLKQGTYSEELTKKKFFQTGSIYPDQCITIKPPHEYTVTESQKYFRAMISAYGKHIVIQDRRNIDIWQITNNGNCTFLYEVDIKEYQHCIWSTFFYNHHLFKNIFIMEITDNSSVALDLITRKKIPLSINNRGKRLLGFDYSTLIFSFPGLNKIQLWQCAKKGFGSMDISAK